MHIDVSALSQANQDYVKALFTLSEWNEKPVTAKVLADQVGVRLSSASDAVRRLAGLGLVDHTPYGAITLTEKGLSYALAMVRRHRLLESFLVEVLDYRWDQVHEEAEHLEHAVSDFMVDQIDKYLGYPTRDPHGDPIPTKDGHFPQGISATDLCVLTELPPNTPAVIERINDADPELLQYFHSTGIVVGATVEVATAGPFAEAKQLRVQGTQEPILLGHTALQSVWVKTHKQHLN
ncbi:metal-dependent transcriptional regulator [Corynebacterium felinum]|uniref:Diphtheria toxin repressor n=1 Tax=Corynebacterium felinum TaxID=131318 RepID=A0ABU2B4N7_9CORY|nr:metal-dependent transcriptional regulator [Corynebacterium felinum]MDF5820522.1 metal-dependent transcriptional regulator [Corynebacterium felinum]MDR7353568.1 DtxR family Mn-dependent transcriptional regulator [Corynebacterium felinum]WJY95748.1 Iron-dependent repressor IdeR [Corynebacterium felinum]